MLDTKHGADYFRRWHRDKRNSGGLMLSRRLSPKGGGVITAPSAGPEVKGLPVHVSGAGPQPYDGVNAADSRLARNGNQYTNVPPDGGICAGKNGVKVQTVNSAFGFFSALRRWSTAMRPKSSRAAP